jgi:predicted dehydrogenase
VTTRAAIVGLGWWGKVLVDSVWEKSDRIRFVAAHTRTPSKVEDFCRTKGLRLYASHDELLASPEIDAIVYAIPHTRHEAFLESAARAGKHVYMEKPLALTVESAKRCISIVRRTGITLAVGFQRRLTPAHLALKKLVNDDAFGVLVHCAAEATAPGALALRGDSWRADEKETPAGAMTPIGIHALDAMIDLFGEIDQVFCVNLQRAGSVADTTTVLLSFVNGASGTLVCSLATARNYRFTVYGTHGLGEVTRAAIETLRLIPAGSGDKTLTKPETVEYSANDPERASLEQFADAITSGTQFPIPASQLVHGIAALEAIVRSAESGAPVKLDRTA